MLIKKIFLKLRGGLTVNQMNFRDKLLISIIPIMVISTIVLAMAAYKIAKDVVLNTEIKGMEQMVKKTVSELDAWIADREKEATLFSQNKIFKDYCEECRKSIYRCRGTGMVSEIPKALSLL